MGTVTAPVRLSHSSPICAACVAMFILSPLPGNVDSPRFQKKSPSGVRKRIFGKLSLFLISRNIAVPQDLAPSPYGGLPRRHRASPSVALDKKSCYSIVTAGQREFSVDRGVFLYLIDSV